MKRFLIGLAAIVAVLVNPAAFAQVKISALPDATALAGTEQVPVVQSAVTAKMTPAQINTYIRSLAGTWTGNQAVTGTVASTGQASSTFVATSTVPSILAFSTDPQIELRDSNAAANNQRWNFNTGSASVALRACTDAGVCSNAVEASRTNGAVTTLTFGNAADNPAFTWLGTGAWTVGGGVGSSSQVLTSNGPGVAPTWQAAGGGVTLANGVWTPTCTLGSNAEACTGVAGQYLRVGATVSWSARFNADSTGSATFAVNLTLPIASNFATVTDAIGTCTSPSTSISAGGVQADGTTDLLVANINASQTTTQTFYCSGTYRVI